MDFFFFSILFAWLNIDMYSNTIRIVVIVVGDDNTNYSPPQSYIYIINEISNQLTTVLHSYS